MDEKVISKRAGIAYATQSRGWRTSRRIHQPAMIRTNHQFGRRPRATFMGRSRSRVIWSVYSSIACRIGTNGVFENATLSRSANRLGWSFTSSKTGLNMALPRTAQFFAQGNTPVEETTIAIRWIAPSPTPPPLRGKSKRRTRSTYRFIGTLTGNA